jgi:murein DD-endopeptidase MepM/ murein hydrolase activator NlpD
MRSFGSSRNDTTRKHAGCDLYAPTGTHVFAVSDGKITYYGDFYGQTYEIEIDHGDYIIRYGEVQPPRKNPYKDDPPPENNCNGLVSGIMVGSMVKQGQHIGYVGQLRLYNKKTKKIEPYYQSMLHLEMYKGNAKGSLSNYTNMQYDNVPIQNYQRRKDLLNPSSFLDNCE